MAKPRKRGLAMAKNKRKRTGFDKTKEKTKEKDTETGKEDPKEEESTKTGATKEIPKPSRTPKPTRRRGRPKLGAAVRNLKDQVSGYEVFYRIVANKCRTQEIENSNYKKFKIKAKNAQN